MCCSNLVTIGYDHVLIGIQAFSILDRNALMNSSLNISRTDVVRCPLGQVAPKDES
jgi:hypothetical protein